MNPDMLPSSQRNEPQIDVNVFLNRIVSMARCDASPNGESVTIRRDARGNVRVSFKVTAFYPVEL